MKIFNFLLPEPCTIYCLQGAFPVDFERSLCHGAKATILYFFFNFFKSKTDHVLETPFHFSRPNTKKMCIFFGHFSQKNIKDKNFQNFKNCFGQSIDITSFNLNIKFDCKIFKIVAVFFPVNPIWRLFFLVSIATAR